MTNEKRLEDLLAEDMIEMANRAAENQIPEIIEQQDYSPKSNRSYKGLITTAAIALTVPIVAIGIVVGGYFGIKAYTGNSPPDSNPSAYVLTPPPTASPLPEITATIASPGSHNNSETSLIGAYRCNKDAVVDSLTQLLLTRNGGNNIDIVNPNKESVTAMLDKFIEPGVIAESYQITTQNGTYNFEVKIIRQSGEESSFFVQTQDLDAANRFSDALTNYTC